MIREKWHDNISSVGSEISSLALNSSYFLHSMQSLVKHAGYYGATDWGDDYELNNHKASVMLRQHQGALNYSKQMNDFEHNVEIIINHDAQHQGIPITKLNLLTAKPLNMPDEYNDFILNKKAQMIVKNNQNNFVDLYVAYKNNNLLSKLTGAIAIAHTVFEATGFEHIIHTGHIGNSPHKHNKPNKPKTITSSINYIRSHTSILDNDGLDKISSLLPSHKL